MQAYKTAECIYVINHLTSGLFTVNTMCQVGKICGNDVEQT